MPAVPDPPPPPAPEDATSWTEFTGRLRALYDWCGRPKYRALCIRCPGLSPATVSTLIGRNPLTRPPETATARFVEACLRYRDWPDAEGEVARWTAHRTLIDGAGAGVSAGGGSAGAADGRGGGRRRWYVAGAVVVLVLVAALVVFAVGRVSGGAGEDCHHVRGSIEDSRLKRTWPHMYQCPNRPRVEVYETAGFGTEVAVLETDPSWFICWTHGERHPGGNDIWYYTQGDRATGMPELNGWGYVPASVLRVERAPDPVITRRCG